tara:strand:- start:51651 stop:52679 length:1029 start_codon:yes stop_codon:yes gene_type:complete
MWIKMKTFFLPGQRRAPRSSVATAIELPVVLDEGVALDADERIEQVFMDMLFGISPAQDAPLNGFERKALKAFAAVLDANLSDNQLVPRLPTVLPRLMSAFRDPSTTSKEMADLIGRDIMTLSEVIRLANSPFYRRAIETRSVEQAVNVIGRIGLQQMVANLLVRPIFSERQGHFSAIAGALLWEQSEKTAVVAAALAGRGKADEFSAYLAGISSNLGLVIGCRILDNAYDGTQLPSSLLFRTRWLKIARQLTSRVVRVWDFPDAACVMLEQLCEPSAPKLAPDTLRLNRAQHLSQFHCLQTRDRLPVPVPVPDTQSETAAAGDSTFVLAMKVLARLEGRKN